MVATSQKLMWHTNIFYKTKPSSPTAGGTTVSQIKCIASRSKHLFFVFFWDKEPSYKTLSVMPTDFFVMFYSTLEQHHSPWAGVMYLLRLRSQILLIDLFIDVCIYSLVTISTPCGVTVLLILICTLPQIHVFLFSLLFLSQHIYFIYNLCLVLFPVALVSWLYYHQCAVKCFPLLDNTQTHTQTQE